MSRVVGDRAETCDPLGSTVSRAGTRPLASRRVERAHDRQTRERDERRVSSVVAGSRYSPESRASTRPEYGRMVAIGTLPIHRGQRPSATTNPWSVGGEPTGRNPRGASPAVAKRPIAINHYGQVETRFSSRNRTSRKPSRLLISLDSPSYVFTGSFPSMRAGRSTPETRNRGDACLRFRAIRPRQMRIAQPPATLPTPNRVDWTPGGGSDGPSLPRASSGTPEVSVGPPTRRMGRTGTHTIRPDTHSADTRNNRRTTDSPKRKGAWGATARGTNGPREESRHLSPSGNGFQRCDRCVRNARARRAGGQAWIWFA